MLKILADSAFQVRNAGEGSAPNSSPRDFGEETFNLIEPTCASWCKVNGKAGMPSEPALHRWRFVRSIVIEHEMHLELDWHLGIDASEELQEFLVPMSSMAAPRRGSRAPIQQTLR
jgi:hypothetical protein